MLRESGLSDYLVLLSIFQTCRYKGVSFLKFLVSGLRDIDSFCEGKRSRRRWSAILLYPKGYVPPHLKSRKSRRLGLQSDKPDGKGRRCHQGERQSSQNQNPSRSTTSPTVTGMSVLNSGHR